MQAVVVVAPTDQAVTRLEVLAEAALAEILLEKHLITAQLIQAVVEEVGLLVRVHPLRTVVQVVQELSL
jgi:hypothetical protein